MSNKQNTINNIAIVKVKTIANWQTRQLGLGLYTVHYS